MPFDFNGSSQDVRASNSISGINTTTCTIAAWINMDTLPTGGATRVFFAQGENTPASAAHWRNFEIRDGGTTRLALGHSGSGGNHTSTGSTDLSTGTWYHVACIWQNDSTPVFYLNGALETTNVVSAGATYHSDYDSIVIGADETAAQWFDGKIARCAIWAGVQLTANEILGLARGVSPLRVRPNNLKYYWIGNRSSQRDEVARASHTYTSSPSLQTIDVGVMPDFAFNDDLWKGNAAAGTTAYTLTASAASFTLSGKAINLLDARLLTAALATFAMTGNSVTLNKGFTILADVASFLLSGQAVTFARTYILAAAQAAYTFTGRAANTLVGRAVAAAPAAFTFTGQAANFARTYVLAAQTAAFSFAGQVANLVYSAAGAVSGLYTQVHHYFHAGH